MFCVILQSLVKFSVLAFVWPIVHQLDIWITVPVLDAWSSVASRKKSHWISTSQGFTEISGILKVPRSSFWMKTCRTPAKHSWCLLNPSKRRTKRPKPKRMPEYAKSPDQTQQWILNTTIFFFWIPHMHQRVCCDIRRNYEILHWSC